MLLRLASRKACDPPFFSFAASIMTSAFKSLDRTLAVHGFSPYILCQTGGLMASISQRTRTPTDREYKSERLELRLAPSAKQLIQQAMSITGMNAGDLAYEGARRVLDEHQRMVLTGADREAFLDAVMNPPEPPERLVSALRRHCELFG